MSYTTIQREQAAPHIGEVTRYSARTSRAPYRRSHPAIQRELNRAAIQRERTAPLLSEYESGVQVLGGFGGGEELAAGGTAGGDGVAAGIL